MKITKSFVDKATAPANKDQIFYRDEELKGFALRITSSGTKSFVVEKLIGNKVKRITLGKYGALSVEQARKEAQKLIGQIVTGKDPVAEKQAARVKGVTLKEVFEAYLAARKSLKSSTIKGYKNVYDLALSKWHSKPIVEISKDMIAAHHKSLGENHGEAYANLTMRFLRALFNFAAAKYEDTQGKSLILENPTKRLSQTRAWYRVERRKTMIKSHELAVWYQGVQQLLTVRSLDNAMMWQDYFLLVLFTGLRRTEAASIRASRVDLKSKTFTVYDTKNHEDHTLPMSDFLFDLFERRIKANPGSEFIFPSNSASGHITDPKKAVARIVETSGITFTTHDLRRTFITLAESLDIAAYTLKRLLNHKMRNDVTAGYIVADVERLRKPMQLITDNLLKAIEIA